MISRNGPILLAALCLGLPGAAARAGAETPSRALVIRLTGEAMVERPGASRAEPLGLLDRLAAGSVVETAAASEMTLVFFNGRRFGVGPESRIVIEDASVRTEAGTVRRLTPVPALAEIPRLDRSAHPGRLPGAGRIRLPELAALPELGLYPCDGAAVVSGEATLHFTPIAGIGEYRIEVMDEEGRRVFSVEASGAEVPLDPGVLEPGAFYSWRVSTRGAEGWQPRSTALFATLAEEDARARRRLAEQAAAAADPALELLLAEVDRDLGLRREACDRLASAAGAAATSGREPLFARFGCRATPGVGAVVK